ncbi:transmembrane and ubiquitin-like domain-containing protein 1 [Dreissena polymorpha]|uniref:Ubiquitin-like domain-containing protein n=1 Tax=Dreissena polymorpha TaxID=45954 RepID=A0A9D3YEW6_DREPO|nr:transmembrane and ubiquitin-like domain-containing protein 1 [Dreissena polymorpha]XP_052253415.1 transmembrane and ubiquitin-like domain-containing protein 1 [Dreissena polymorpha]XP_052253416.1 transmembrane and ubiquitin-like domain-containing protein 1 [Dreissena polymorpha]XP_052253417.1 transmembrane and ubiquitin-like domain-containing protein 1 [Dreissena polymorpha]KAH3699252.1 hypothetical protein DPMN_074208 [Dreissena polymorpha]
MSWIEGVGDEVTIAFIITLIIGIILVAWISTGIREIPFIRVIIVQLRRQHARINQDLPSPSQPGTVPEEASGSSDAGNLQPEVTAAFNAATTPESSSDDDGTSVDGAVARGSLDSSEETCRDLSDAGISNVEQSESEGALSNLSADELRQRRLDFLSGKSVQTASNNEVLPSNESVESSTQHFSPPAGTSDNLTASVAKKSLTQLASNLLSQPIETLQNDGNTDQQNVCSESGNLDQSEQSDADRLPGEIRVRIKFLNDTQRLVTAQHTETIGNFRRRHFAAELEELKLVRFIFNGRDLRDDSSTLESCSINDNSVVHCLVTQQRRNEDQNTHVEEHGLDIGLFMFPIFGLLLASIWYLRFSYRQLFNVTSTLTLAGISFLFLLALSSRVRPVRNGHEHID